MNMDETWVNHGVKETYPNICANRRFDFPALWDRVCENGEEFWWEIWWFEMINNHFFPPLNPLNF